MRVNWRDLDHPAPGPFFPQHKKALSHLPDTSAQLTPFTLPEIFHVSSSAPSPESLAIQLLKRHKEKVSFGNQPPPQRSATFPLASYQPQDLGSLIAANRHALGREVIDAGAEHEGLWPWQRPLQFRSSIGSPLIRAKKGGRRQQKRFEPIDVVERHPLADAL